MTAPTFALYTQVAHPAILAECLPGTIEVPKWFLVARTRVKRLCWDCWRAETEIPCSEPLVVLCRVPDRCIDIAVGYEWLGGRETFRPALDRVTLVHRKEEVDHARGRWFIADQVFDFVKVGSLF